MLDTNPVIRGADGDLAVCEQLLADWVDVEVRFGVAGHTYTEIDRRDDEADRQRHKRYADRLGRVAGDGGAALRIEAEIVAELGEAAKSYRGDLALLGKLVENR